MEDDGAERSTQEIRLLISKLDPNKTSHKDRIRRLNKFRNFVTGEGGPKDATPEFYDDDIPILLLGSEAPAALIGDDPEVLDGSLTGLLQACGSPSVEHDHQLKRSARHAMSLLKFLVCDYVEQSMGAPMTGLSSFGSLNLFAQAFCSLPARYYSFLSLDLHVVGDQRGGAKEDACAIMVLILCHHVQEDGETPSPLDKSDLLATPSAQQAFEIWLTKHTDRDVQTRIKQNGQARSEELARQERLEENGGILPEDEDDEDEEGEEDFVGEEDGALAGLRRRKKAAKKEMMEATQSGDLELMKGPALRWEDSQLYREQRARFAAHQRMQQGGEFHDTVRDSQEAAAELAEREEEKAKVLRKDPLGLKETDFDLRTIESNQVDFLEQALLELNEELRKVESGTEAEKSLRAKKESLESILDAVVGIAAASGEKAVGDTGHSIIPTEADFDPLLFLTLVHRKASYEELVGSMDRLSNDTENQVRQLQNMVRENFALFLRCADGIDTFNEKTLAQSGPGLIDRLNRLDALAESCAHQAKKSFKPLLDNASEVRKVQSALAVLQRVAPMLQAPIIMRQHVEHGRFSQALKAYRRVLVIEDNCNIELLNHVKVQAADCAREARRELERRLAQDKEDVPTLLEAIRDLGELLELDIPEDPQEAAKASTKNPGHSGRFTIGTIAINVREHTPAISCLLLQSAHFVFEVENAIQEADQKTLRIFEGEPPSSPSDASVADSRNGLSDEKKDASGKTKTNSSSNQWKYDVLEARGLATVKAVELCHTWLPRLLNVAKAAREDDKRRAARVTRRRSIAENQLTPFEIFITNVAPSVTRLVEHAAFCGLGSAPRGSGMDVVMTFGKKSPDKLRALLRSPLPPSQSARVGKELADMVEVLSQSAAIVNELRPSADAGSLYNASPLDQSRKVGEASVTTIEKRRCIYAFDICARTSASKASGAGKFDADALLSCLKTLSQELTRPEQCAGEVEKGCELVIRRCCDGLASYVRDRGDAARLSAVAECADVLLDRISDVIREVGYLTNNAEAVEEVMMEDIMGLEGAMFDEFLENIRATVQHSCRIGFLDARSDPSQVEIEPVGFPTYLASCLLLIVRCRAQVEEALGKKIRRSEGVSYLHISMTTVAEAVMEGLCSQIQGRKTNVRVRQADHLANELQFLTNTLKSYLGQDTLEMVDETRSMLVNKAGRGGGVQGEGPDGLAALEDLERLGRVYVLCLGE